MFKKIVSITLILINIFLLTGCWDYKEVESLSIVAGIAVDKGGKSKYHFTFDLAETSGSGKDTKVMTKLVDMDANSFFEATQLTSKKISKTLNWSNAQIIIISQDLAKEGILKVLDFVFRNEETRLTLEVLISGEKTAGEILELSSIANDVHSFAIDKQLENNQQSLSNVPYILLYEIMSTLQSKGTSLALPVIKKQKNSKEETSLIEGAAIFNKNMLIGFLEEKDSANVQYVTDKIESAVIESEELGLTFEVYKNKTEVTPTYKGGKLSIEIKTNTEMAINEDESTMDYSTDEKQKEVINQLEQSLEKRISETIKKVQTDYGTDIFGFGDLFSKKYPKQMKALEDNWSESFKQIEVKVTSKIKIRNSGVIYKPAKPS